MSYAQYVTEKRAHLKKFCEGKITQQGVTAQELLMEPIRVILANNLIAEAERALDAYSDFIDKENQEYLALNPRKPLFSPLE